MSIEHNGRIIDDDEARDIIASVAEMQKQIAGYKRTLRAIAAMCNAPHWTSDRRWKIEELASGRKAPNENA